MSRPLTLRLPRAAYFVTAVTQGRRRLFRNPTHCRTVLDALAFQRNQGKLRLFAYVVMPDHLHWIFIPTSGHNTGGVVRDFKTFTAKAIRQQAVVVRDSQTLAAFAFAAVSRRRQAFKVWQDGEWTEPLIENAALHSRIEYLHANPVRAGLVEAAVDYPWSSARCYAGLPGSPLEVDSLPD